MIKRVIKRYFVRVQVPEARSYDTAKAAILKMNCVVVVPFKRRPTATGVPQEMFGVYFNGILENTYTDRSSMMVATDRYLTSRTDESLVLVIGVRRPLKRIRELV